MDSRTVADHGEAGREIAAWLRDMQIEQPHAGDDWNDHQRLTDLRMSRHEYEAACAHGISGSRDLAVGEYNLIAGHAGLDLRPLEERQHVFTEIHHRGDNNLKDLGPRAQALLERSEHLPGWSPTSRLDLQEADPERRHKYLNRFTAVRRGTPLVPAWDPREDLPAMHPMTAIVVGPQGEAVHTDEMGRVKVSIQGLDPEEHEHAHGAGTSGTDRDSAWVRFASLWAGSDYGVWFPLRAGMEVRLGWEMGDPDRPMITHVLYGRVNRPPRFSDVGTLPHNRHLSGIKSREIRGTRHNQLRFDDTHGQIGAQLESEHGHSQLNLGWLIQPRKDGRGVPRGEGAELCTDESLALRSAKALLVSAWKRLDACAGQLDAQEHEALMQDCLDLFKSLGRYAAEHQGLALDDTPAGQLQADVKAASAGSNVDPGGQGGEPTLSLTAPAGIAATTPKTILSYAGVNIDSVAQQHMQYTAGGHFSLNAGRGIGLFAHRDGIRAIAHHGPLLLQSQHDDTKVDSAKDIKLTAAGGKLLGMAQDEITFMTAGGAYLKLSGGGVEIGGPGPLHVKTDGHHWDGPASAGVELPSFSEGDLGRTPRLLRPADGEPVQGAGLDVTQPDAADVSSQTDAAGRGAKIVADRLQRLKNFFRLPR